MIQQTIFLDHQIQLSIQRLQEFEPPEGYDLEFSGGKDSIVLKRLADMAQVKYDAHMRRTTVDPPELIRYNKKSHPDVTIHRPPMSMFDLIVENGCPPLRQMRYCCRVFKESFGTGRVVLTGVRRAEGANRRNRNMVHSCPAHAKILVNPIIDWIDEWIWDFIYRENLPYCSLYDEGFDRIGCILCPASKQREYEAIRWPRFYNAFLWCFGRMLERRERLTKKTTWRTAQQVMDWWLERKE